MLLEIDPKRSAAATGFPVVVAAARMLTPQVRAFELRAADGRALSPFTAGAHLTLGLPDGLWRSYSLTNAPGPTDHYEIAVGLAPDSRGGSRHMHAAVAEGDVLLMKGPFNTFPLRESATHTLMIAGGIGITPFVSMARRLAEIGRPWTLYYSARTRAHMAFAEALHELAAAGDGAVLLHPDDEANGRFIDMAALAAAYSDADAYCCGPPAMLLAYQIGFSRHPDERRHAESFKPAEPAPGGERFTFELSRSGLTLEVAPGRSILEAVEAAGIDHPFSCREGTCGTCETGVIDGLPDHRDQVLTEKERARNRSMMLCVSRSLGPRLVLDL
jgi:tetrachlorobenzoquinone reductase